MEDQFIEILTQSQDWGDDDLGGAKKSTTKDETSRLETFNIAHISEQPNVLPHEFLIERDSINAQNATSDYLILGIDAEYQSLQDNYSQDEVRESKAKYRVLSYQYYAINNNGTEWSGIAIPEPGERISLSEFVIFALARGAQLGEVIPTNLIVVGHYNRADLPAFDDKKKIFGHVQNIRNSMVSLRAPINLRIKFSEDEGDHVDLKLLIRDTILMAPTGRRSLLELGKLIGVEKIKLSDDPEEELHIKQNMTSLLELDWETFREYALKDAEIAAKYFSRVTQQYQEIAQTTDIPTALSNIGVKLLKKEWASRTRPVNALEVVGKEEVKETIYDERTGAFTTRKSKPYVEEISWFIDFGTECYHGGRNEQLWFGPSWADNWTDYDFSSAYPTAMALIGKPNWRTFEVLTDLSSLSADDLACVCVDFRFPDAVRYPTLPVRTQHGILFPLEGRSYCCSPEIELARNLGCQMTLRYGVKIPQDKTDRVFFPFIKSSIARRQQAKDPIEKAFWKELTNSCYGKTAQGLRDKRIFNLKKKSSERVPPSDISNPFYAGYITSFVRAVVGEVMNAVPNDRMIFSVTTDGFITNANREEIQAAQMGRLCRRFSNVRLELTGDPKIIEEKHNVRRLIGWRTRGQATLEAGEPSPGSEAIILARAGIKPPVYTTELKEQNDFICNMFFDRTPKTAIELDVHTSFREMIMFDADLVSKRSAKRISMESDFKRRPFSIVQPDQDESGPPFRRHVSFSTVPWTNVTDFMAVRKCFNDYWAKSPQCMKTNEDYRDFAELYDGLKAIGTKNARYLKTKNGALMRLQRDLCRAFKSGAAGLQNYKNMSAQEFADALNQSGMEDLGVRTLRSTVENGKKVLFEPKTTPPTKDVLDIMNRLEIIFPDLNRTEFLASIQNDWSLSDALSAECPFTQRLMEEAFSTSLVV